jgi:ribulose-phosphate 3-epimerase
MNRTRFLGINCEFPLVAPSVLSADFLNLGAELKSIEDAGADLVHLDIMDAHFVPNISFGSSVVKAVRRGTSLPLIAHLMIDYPLEYATRFAEIGVEAVSFHIEAVSEPFDVLKSIRELGLITGLAIKPSTKIDNYEQLIERCDFILIMSVEPGFSGQSFIPDALPKIEQLAKTREKLGRFIPIEVDGGINDITSRLCIDAGADILVSANYIFGSSNRKGAIEGIKNMRR